MSLGRRKVRVDDPASWVFNRMVDAYAARPAYPAALLEALAALAGGPGAAIADLGAGIGHVALPLAARGFDVRAIEPAAAMLERLRAGASERGLAVRAVHAAAEAMPLEAASIDLVVVSDALHFLDAELAGAEIARVLTARGALALVTCQFGDAPFMRAVAQAMKDAVPRRPRALSRAVVQLSAVTRVPFAEPVQFHDETPMDPPTLERVLQSVSFIGPAMNAARFAAFRERVHAIAGRPVWSRTFTLLAGRRSPSRRAILRARSGRHGVRRSARPGAEPGLEPRLPRSADAGIG